MKLQRIHKEDETNTSHENIDPSMESEKTIHKPDELGTHDLSW